MQLNPTIKSPYFAQYIGYTSRSV